MNEENQQPEKDHFVLYLVLATVVMVGAILAAKFSEDEKFEPIKEQLIQESQQMNIRVLSNRGE